jgi:hypothetical protein
MLGGMGKLSPRAVRLLAALLATCASACGGAVERVATTPPVPDAAQVEPRMVGQWELTAFEVRREGEVLSRRARGELVYDAFANIAVRVELQPDDPEASPPRVVVLDFTAKAAADPGRGELSYIGLQIRVPAERLVAEAVDAREWRRYSVEGDVLRLTVARADGSAQATLTWRRVGR